MHPVTYRYICLQSRVVVILINVSKKYIVSEKHDPKCVCYFNVYIVHDQIHVAMVNSW